MPVDCGLEFGSDQHVKEIFQRAARDRIPTSGTFDITHRCNFRCRHCYVGHLVAQPRAQARELSPDQIERLLKEAADAGCVFLLISGGEPLLRDDFAEIYVRARRLGMVVSVFTNASLVRSEHLEVFREYPPRHVEITLYGATRGTYEGVTGLRGSYEAVHRGIDKLLDAGVRVDAKSMILKDNVHEIADMAKWAEDLGMNYRVDALVTPRLDGERSPLESRVDPEAAVKAEMGIEKVASSIAEFVQKQKTESKNESVGVEHMYRCGAGRSGFQIDPAGVMHPCLMTTTISADVIIAGFESAWKAIVAAVERAAWSEGGECATCPSIYLCGYCAALLLLEGATPSEPPDYLCRLGECRARALGM